MTHRFLKFFLLSLLSSGLLSAGFLFPHCGAMALIAFVPLLWMDRLADEHGVKHFWPWHYLTFVLWNAFTTFWVCNATVGGGIAAILINAAEMSVIWALFRLSKKKFTGALPYVFLASMWIAWERAYFSAEVSWPWLTLGNAFASTTSCIQWYEYTGTLGGSLWVWLCNLTVFGLSAACLGGQWKKFNRKARTAAVSAFVLVFAGPVIWSFFLNSRFEEKRSRATFSVCALQPNLDPYMKFEKYSQDEQDAILMDLITEAGKTDSVILFVAPETVTNDIVVNDIEKSRTLGHLREATGNCNSILFGASSYEFIRSATAPSYTARRMGEGVWYENHNSALMSNPCSQPQIYHKSRLVIGTEKMPWPGLFSKIDDMLGGVIARCTGQEEVSLLDYEYVRDSATHSIPVGCAVCYESVYPEYFASYVKAGALAMAVITNDAWWGDTPGYRQHMSYSRLRAIETRRDIIRSANTGISCLINQRGDIVSSLGWDTRGVLKGTLNCNDRLTPFVLYGDITGRIATFLFLLLAGLLAVRMITGRGKAMAAVLFLLLAAPCETSAFDIAGMVGKSSYGKKYTYYVPYTGRSFFNFVPDKILFQISESQYSRALKSTPLSKDKKKTEQVKRVTDRLVAAVKRLMAKEGRINELGDYCWEAHLIVDEEANACCYPFGRMFVNTGMYQVVDDDASLAVILSHEIAHAISKHSSEQITKGMISAVGVSVLISIINSSDMDDSTKNISKLIAASGVTLTNLKFSRINEAEADKLGLIILVESGYKPESAVMFWEKMMKHSGNTSKHDWYSTHPSDANRIENLKSLLPEAEAYAENHK